MTLKWDPKLHNDFFALAKEAEMNESVLATTRIKSPATTFSKTLF